MDDDAKIIITAIICGTLIIIAIVIGVSIREVVNAPSIETRNTQEFKQKD
jgi:hypothetical protein